MNITKTIGALALTFALVCGINIVASAQSVTNTSSPNKDAAQKKSGGVLGKIFGQNAAQKKSASKTVASPSSGASSASPAATAANSSNAPERLEPDDATTAAPTGVSNEAIANRREQMSEEVAAITPYYNNFFKDYRIGPEDVISIRVFGQERYSVPSAVVPPDGVVSHPLIPEGVRVVGKTREQVQAELTKRLDEYIIDPKVTVSIDKSMSYRYSVVGAVAQPGIHLMGRRLTAYEAIMEAGGVTNLADKKKVFVLRRTANGTLAPTIVDIAAIERGKKPDDYYLSPGDQVFVPNNKFKYGIEQVTKYLPIISFARVFGF